MPRRRGKRVQSGHGWQVVDKAANGTGSIYPVGDRYKATYRDPITGKRRTVTGKTKAEAAERREAKLEELQRTTPVGELGADPCVDEIAHWWLTNVKTDVRPSTRDAYRKNVDRIVRQIGGRPVATVTTETVLKLVTDLRTGTDRNKKLAAVTVGNTLGALRQILDTAIVLGYLDAPNPAKGVKVPRQTAEERTPKRSLTVDEVHRLLVALDPNVNPFDAAVGILFTAGLRVEEVLGLAWPDLDLDAGTASIVRGSTYTGKGIGVQFDKPKTERTAGVVYLPPTVVGLLRAHRRRQAAERLAAGPAWRSVTYQGAELPLVFTLANGAPPTRNAVYDATRAACERADIDPTRVGTHTGRRTVVTTLFQAGLAIDDVARHVGHASPATTAGYVTDLGDRPKKTADVAAALLDPATQDDTGT